MLCDLLYKYIIIMKKWQNDIFVIKSGVRILRPAFAKATAGKRAFTAEPDEVSGRTGLK
jgi:hypothetical protein